MGMRDDVKSKADRLHRSESGASAGVSKAGAGKGWKDEELGDGEFRVWTYKSRASDLELLRRVFDDLGWQEDRSKEGWSRCKIMWVCAALEDKPLPVLAYKPDIRVSRFEGMRKVSKKVENFNRFKRMQRLFPDHFDFCPPTWVLPADRAIFEVVLSRQTKKKKPNTYIIKPSEGSQGAGIYLAQHPSDLVQLDHVDDHKQWVAQRYVDKPMLLDGHKFDLRLYVLIASVDPPRVYLCREGLVRLASEAYCKPAKENLQDVYKHLTNYSLNKTNENYVHTTVEEFETDEGIPGVGGSKRLLSDVVPVLEEKGVDVDKMWEQVIDMVAKTVLATLPSLCQAYRRNFPRQDPAACGLLDDSYRCFQIMGFDVLLDKTGKPHLLEVNSKPAFSVLHEQEREDGVLELDVSPIDLDVKALAVGDALKIISNPEGPPDSADDVDLGSYCPVLTKQIIEEEYEEMLVYDRARVAYELHAGCRGGMSSTQFGMMIRSCGVGDPQEADMVFSQAISDASNGFSNRSMNMDTFADALILLAAQQVDPRAGEQEIATQFDKVVTQILDRTSADRVRRTSSSAQSRWVQSARRVVAAHSVAGQKRLPRRSQVKQG